MIIILKIIHSGAWKLVKPLDFPDFCINIHRFKQIAVFYIFLFLYL